MKCWRIVWLDVKVNKSFVNCNFGPDLWGTCARTKLKIIYSFCPCHLFSFLWPFCFSPGTDFFTIQNWEISLVPCVWVLFQGPVPTETEKSAFLDRHTTNQRSEGAPNGCILLLYDEYLYWMYWPYMRYKAVTGKDGFFSVFSLKCGVDSFVKWIMGAAFFLKFGFRPEDTSTSCQNNLQQTR